jgi:hypothetical protein
MENNINIKYTDTAKEQLEEFKKQQVQLLEDHLVKDKYVIGDDLVEITASDIKEALDDMKVIYPGEQKSLFKSESMKLASLVYVILGVLITIGSMYYDYFQELLFNNPSKAFLLMLGITMTVMGVILNFIIRKRELDRKK